MAVTLSGGAPTFTTGYQGGTIISGTAVASTSGTSIDFTSIPSWVKRITVMFNGVSTNGTTNLCILIGSGSFSTTGYTSSVWTANTNLSTDTTLFKITAVNAAAYVTSGIITLATLGSNVWTQSATLASTGAGPSVSGGSITLGGALDRVRITTGNGTDTFDAGSINILYE
jgi:hypothetical protein